MTIGDGRHFSKSYWHCYDNHICGNKEIEDAVPVWNWEEKVEKVISGWSKCMCTHIHTDAAAKGKCTSK